MPIFLSAEPEQIATFSPVNILILVVLLLAIVVITRFGKIEFTTKMLTTVALAIALAVILNQIKLYEMPQGGSVTLVSMLPIFLVSFAYGPQVGFLAGFLFGLMNMILGGYVVHPMQMLLDYPLAFMALGASGYLPKKGAVGMVLGGLLRYFCHILSGVIFFATYAGDQNPWIYSALYNSFLFPELILIIVILSIVPINRLIKAMNKQAEEVKML